MNHPIEETFISHIYIKSFSSQIRSIDPLKFISLLKKSMFSYIGTSTPIIFLFFQTSVDSKFLKIFLADFS